MTKEERIRWLKALLIKIDTTKIFVSLGEYNALKETIKELEEQTKHF